MFVERSWEAPTEGAVSPPLWLITAAAMRGLLLAIPVVISISSGRGLLSLRGRADGDLVAWYSVPC